MRHDLRALAISVSAILVAAFGPSRSTAQLTLSRSSDFSATLLMPSRGQGGGVDLARTATIRQLALTAAFTVSPVWGEAWSAELHQADPARATGWTGRWSVVHLRDANTTGTATIGAWLRHGGITATGSIGRGVSVGRSLAGKGRPYVIGPVGHDTMSFPHDTLTPREAAQRESGSLLLHGTLNGAFMLEGAFGPLQWQARVSHAFGDCCTAHGVARTQADLLLERPVTAGISLIAAAGTHPQMAGMLATGGGPYLNLGIGIRSLPVRSPHVPNTFADFRIDTIALLQTAISITAPDAHRVDVRSSLTGWSIQPMRKDADGRWRLDLPLPAGLHQISIRRDGGEWMVPPGLAAGLDDFGEPVGVLVVLPEHSTPH